MKQKLLSTFLFIFLITITTYSQVANQPNDLMVCDNFGANDGIAIFDLTFVEQEVFGAQNPSDFTITYHISQTNAEANVNAISNPMSYMNDSNPTTIFVRLTENSSGNYDTTAFTLIVSLLPIINQPSLFVVCDENNDGTEIIDFTQMIPEILNGQNPDDFLVQFFLNGIIISDPSNFLITPNTTTFDVAVTALSGCGTVQTSFDLIFEPLPAATQPTPLIACDVNGDGFAEFNLFDKDSEILGGLDPVIFMVVYHETQMDAEAGTNALATPYINVTNPQTVYARVENAETGCYTIVELVLQAIDCSDFGQIVVDAYYDENENSDFDTDEINFTNGYFTYEINNDGLVYTVASSSGHLVLFSENETDSYDITFNLYGDEQNCYSLPVTSFENITVSTGNSVDVEFPVVAIENCEDLAVFLLNPSALPRPGFNFENRIILKNLGNTTIASGTVEFTLDAALVFNSIVEINSNYVVNTTTNGFTVDFNDLEPGDVETIRVSLNCPNTVSLGTLVTNTVTYTTTQNDNVASNNTSTLSQTVIGSYDPNDINESHGPEIVYDDFAASDEYLYYTIRFQNIGTAEAINVRIEDALDSQLDESTFQMLRSSHDYVVTRTNNQLVWQFDDINLPSESMDAEGSNGFVYFKIKPQAGYAIGDIIPNFADIYFDFNPPITTNTFTTEFVETLSVDEQSISSFSIYPNPANDIVNIKLNNGSNVNFKVDVFDVQGKRILSQATTDAGQMELNVSEFEGGLYIIKIANQSSESVHKLIIN